MNIDSLGNRLREARKALGSSQDEMATACGVSREMWGKYERGAAMPGSEVLAKVAAAGADVLYILTGKSSEAAPMALTAEEQTMLSYFREASKEVRRAALGALLGAAQGQSPLATGSHSQISTGAGAMNIGSFGGAPTSKRRK